MILEKGDIMMSLGTSDTLFLPLENPVPNTFANVLCHPNEAKNFMAMIVYKNGSLTRQSIRDQHASGTWQSFNDALKSAPPGCIGYSGFYYLVPEISPRAQGTYFFKDGERVSGIPDHLQPRALIEFQFMAMKRHVTKMGLDPKRIFSTGMIFVEIEMYRWRIVEFGYS